MVTDARLHEMATHLVEIPGVEAVLLGGSRARGTHTPESDTDLGLYYREPLDLPALAAAARHFAGPGAQITAPGEWGPWVDGGGWLTVDGSAVDWIYRDIGRVERAWSDARAGRYEFHAQAGHPLGVPDFAYAGEVALGKVLADRTTTVTTLRDQAQTYPPALREALVAGLWEGDFLVRLARKALPRADTSYLAGCLFRLTGVCVHALHGAAGRWLVTEKGAVASAAALPGAPPALAAHVDALFAAPPAEAVDMAADLVLATADACTMMGR
ncbi:nucleotidyltransferase domain-containing protein [Actinoplanes sp. RD1]|uniref:nucleotidyltransferase domain-containing protein n=1 Tax=Actinoplanes sp. RD1 TaxID=3064538 RepID=UPI002741A715|nr:nucleotidyltransferase domain-containing protein [Actinoplanes sp. RD1]